MNLYSAPPIIFTDLDGTLLDHNDYSFVAAEAALHAIAERNIPLIINSSKTAAEIISLQKKLNITQPFIAENGAAVYTPASDQKRFDCQAFARPRQDILDILNSLRKEYGCQFTGFADANVTQISDMTGLSLGQSLLALDRHFSEPLLWQDNADRLETFLQQLKQHQLIAQQGGRFLTVSSEANKAEAMAWLCQQYDQAHTIIALGDSLNDEAMLNAADIAVVIKSKHADQLVINGAKEVIKTDLAGPSGWQVAMDTLLPLFPQNNKPSV